MAIINKHHPFGTKQALAIISVHGMPLLYMIDGLHFSEKNAISYKNAKVSLVLPHKIIHDEHESTHSWLGASMDERKYISKMTGDSFDVHQYILYKMMVVNCHDISYKE